MNQGLKEVQGLNRDEEARIYIRKCQLVGFERVPEGIAMFKVHRNISGEGYFAQKVYVHPDKDGYCYIDVPAFITELHTVEVVNEWHYGVKCLVKSPNAASILGFLMFVRKLAYQFSDIDLQRVNFTGWFGLDTQFTSVYRLRKFTFGYGGSTITQMGGIFRDCRSLEEIDFGQLDLSNLVDAMQICEGCTSLRHVNLEAFKSQHVNMLWEAFYRCRELKHVDLNCIPSKDLVNCSAMFANSGVLQIDLSSWKPDAEIQLSNFCAGCEYLKQFKFGRIKPENVYQMFERCHSLRDIDITLADFSETRGLPTNPRTDWSIGEEFFYNKIRKLKQK